MDRLGEGNKLHFYVGLNVHFDACILKFVKYIHVYTV